jgi:hypothetical protein
MRSSSLPFAPARVSLRASLFLLTSFAAGSSLRASVLQHSLLLSHSTSFHVDTTVSSHLRIVLRRALSLLHAFLFSANALASFVTTNAPLPLLQRKSDAIKLKLNSILKEILETKRRVRTTFHLLTLSHLVILNSKKREKISVESE